ncbi:MAG: CYTH domain-containing protein [Thermodesulfobacteriota bacterium]
MTNEIERKFLIYNPPPDYHKNPFNEIVQGYIAITEDKEIRVRKKGEGFFQTIKTGEGLIRKETEIEITREQFDALWPITEQWRIEKKRYEIKYDNYLIELDFYKGKLADLIVAEVEFKSEEESSSFNPPDWFGREITDDKGFKNKNLAISGIPKS